MSSDVRLPVYNEDDVVIGYLSIAEQYKGILDHPDKKMIVFEFGDQLIVSSLIILELQYSEREDNK